MDRETLRKLLEDVEAGRLDVRSAVERLRNLPYEDLGFAIPYPTPLLQLKMIPHPKLYTLVLFKRAHPCIPSCYSTLLHTSHTELPL